MHRVLKLRSRFWCLLSLSLTIFSITVHCRHKPKYWWQRLGRQQSNKEVTDTAKTCRAARRYCRAPHSVITQHWTITSSGNGIGHSAQKYRDLAAWKQTIWSNVLSVIASHKSKESNLNRTISVLQYDAWIFTFLEGKCTAPNSV